jgi:hypothetical protein
MPLAMPSLAESDWMSMAIRLLATITQRRVYPNWAPPAMFVAKLPGSTYATLAINAGPRKGNRLANLPFLLFPRSTARASLSVCESRVSGVEDGLVFGAMSPAV